MKALDDESVLYIKEDEKSSLLTSSDIVDNKSL